MVILKDILRDLLYSRHSCRLKIKMYIMSCELNFIWVKIRTIAQEREFQIALRNFSKELGKGQCYV